MKAIVIKQPWAWAIIVGHKKIENRTWQTSYRGDLLIVAGKATDRIKPASRFLVKHNITVPDKLIFGAAIGIVTLTNIKPVEECGGPFAEGPWCWILCNPRKLNQPVPVRGQTGFFEAKI